MEEGIERFTVVITPELRKRYLLARAAKLVKGRDMQVLMRQRFEEILDNLFMKKNNGNKEIDSKEVIYNNNILEESRKRKNAREDDYIPESFGMFQETNYKVNE